MFLSDIIKEIYFLFIEMAPYLLIGLVFVGLLHVFISKDMVLRHVGKKNFWSVVKASLFGVPLPLCSCGVVPTTVYLSKNGASKGSVISFLVSTPQTGIDSIIATYGMLGWIFAIFRPLAAFIMGIGGGLVINAFDKAGREQIVYDKIHRGADKCEGACDDNCDCAEDDCRCKAGEKKKEGKFKRMYRYAFVNFLDDISLHFIVGLVISGLIAYFVPAGFFSESAFSDGLPGMLLMVLIGAPMYVCATASIPIAVTLIMKGFSPGLAFVFLAVGPATNAASFTIIMNTVGKRLAAAYLLIIVVLSIMFAYMLDWLFYALDADPARMIAGHSGHNMIFNEEIKLILGIVFFILLLLSMYRKFIGRFSGKEKELDNKQKINIEGMSCNHCVENVEKALANVKGVENADVRLDENAAYIEGEYSIEEIRSAVENVGYKVV